MPSPACVYAKPRPVLPSAVITGSARCDAMRCDDDQVDMTFNLGSAGFASFGTFVHLIETRQWKQARARAQPLLLFIV